MVFESKSKREILHRGIPGKMEHTTRDSYCVQDKGVNLSKILGNPLPPLEYVSQQYVIALLHFQKKLKVAFYFQATNETILS